MNIKLLKFYLRKILIIFLPINLNICFGCTKEPSHWDGSFEYPQHMFWMRNKENNFPIGTLICRPACCLLTIRMLSVIDNKDTDQTVKIHLLMCVFMVCK